MGLPGYGSTVGSTGSAIQLAPAAALPHEIHGLTLASWPWSTLLVGVLLGLLFCAGLVVLVRWWQRRPRQDPPSPVGDPWEVLLKRLKAVNIPTCGAQGEIGASQAEELYFHLSTLLRAGIELRLDLPATDRTLPELKEELRNRLPLAPDQVEQVLRFLERADMIKFAEAPCTPEQAQDDLQQVKQWLTRLKPSAISQPGSGVRPTTEGGHSIELWTDAKPSPKRGQSS